MFLYNIQKVLLKYYYEQINKQNKIKNNDINGQASHYQINYGSWLNCWKIIHERFQQTAKQQGEKSANPFSEFLNQTMQAVNFTHKPMIRDEVFKILQLTVRRLMQEETQKIYWRQFHKNDSVKGGSFNIQPMMNNAKCELMKDFPDINEKEILDKIKNEEVNQKGKERKKKKQNKRNRNKIDFIYTVL